MILRIGQEKLIQQECQKAYTKHVSDLVDEKDNISKRLWSELGVTRNVLRNNIIVTFAVTSIIMHYIPITFVVMSNITCYIPI